VDRYECRMQQTPDASAPDWQDTGDVAAVAAPGIARRALVRAGGVAGIAAAFNTPLAGVEFAIKELSHPYKARARGTVYTAVVSAGATPLWQLTCFSQTFIVLANNMAWLEVIVCRRRLRSLPVD
jgi:H+/Cl- antiporter ClcA